MLKLLLFIFVSLSSAASATATAQDQDRDVSDAFSNASSIITSLAQLVEPAEPYQVKELPNRGDAGSGRNGGTRTKAEVMVNPTPFVGRHLGPFHRTTVFSNFDIIGDEISPVSFRIGVISDGFCEDVVVKDRLSGKQLYEKNLDDEKAFSMEVT